MFYFSRYRLRGVCIDNKILVAFFNNGVVCWNIQTGELVIEEMCSEITYIPCDKHVIMLTEGGVVVQHALSYFITNYDLWDNEFNKFSSETVQWNRHPQFFFKFLFALVVTLEKNKGELFYNLIYVFDE